MPMNNKNFRKQAHQMVDWMADYLENIEQYPVKSQSQPGEIIAQLEEAPPTKGEPMSAIVEDFKKTIIPGMTHWQHPNFHAYFPANGSYPSILAEMLTATMGAQCMVWDTSPAAAELEERVMQWLQKMMGIPKDWVGVIQDTASTATLAALLTAREAAFDFVINKTGYHLPEKLRVYCSTETHSSIDKAVKIAGMGSKNLVKVGVDDTLAMNVAHLEQAIKNDIENDHKPLCVVATIGTTGTTAIDPIKAIAEVCNKYKVWLHIDAAYAGTALVLEEYRWMIEGMEGADSFVFNPHKWMFTNFDCSVYFVKNKKQLLNTFEILPEYLKTTVDQQVNNYRDWGIPLGRRFRALKLWFVIRNFGVSGIQQRIREHIAMAQDLKSVIEAHPTFEVLAPVHLNMICFRSVNAENNQLALNEHNKKLNETLNNSGKVYLTHTKINGNYCLRMHIGQTYVRKTHVDKAWKLIQKIANEV